MGIATSLGMSSRPLAVDPTNESLGQRRAVELLVLDQVRIQAWDRLLFIECGDGWLVEEAWRRMAKGYVCGLGTSPRLLELAVRLRGIPGRVEFKTWGGERFPLPDRTFNCVISCVPWVCYRKPLAALREMARVLRPDGAAYLLGYDGSTARVSEDPQAADLERLFAEAGLEEVQRSPDEAASNGQPESASPVVIHARPRRPA